MIILFFLTLQRTQCWKNTRINHLPIIRLQYIPKQTSFVRRKKTSPQHLSKLVIKNTIINLNIASYFLNILASTYVSTQSTTGGPINKTIKNIGLTRHHWQKVERTWNIFNKCKEMEQEYTGNINVTRNLNPPYLLSNLDELNILAD